MTLKINPEDWNRLSIEDQTKTEEVISSFFKGQSIELDPSAPQLSLTDAELSFSWCRTACQVAQAAAIVACAGEPICTTLAIAAGEACKDAC
jgi:hypothetical protein